jgi:hypothetical protein
MSSNGSSLTKHLRCCSSQFPPSLKDDEATKVGNEAEAERVARRQIRSGDETWGKSERGLAQISGGELGPAHVQFYAG